MTLTPKEHSLLCDLKGEEELCIEKYTRYESLANDKTLKSIFSEIKSTEQNHLQNINKMIQGEEVKVDAPKSAVSVLRDMQPSSLSKTEKDEDAYLCRDALSMEKHVSSLYDTTVFEFRNPTLRDTLASIQKQEQNHGEEIYTYMAVNGMYS